MKKPPGILFAEPWGINNRMPANHQLSCIKSDTVQILIHYSITIEIPSNPDHPGMLTCSTAFTENLTDKQTMINPGKWAPSREITGSRAKITVCSAGIYS
jgi:hypothetical protein